MKHKRLRKRTKDSENGGGTEKASEKKTNSENIEALYERLKIIPFYVINSHNFTKFFDFIMKEWNSFPREGILL